MKLVIDIPDKDYEFIRDAHILIGRRNGKTIEYNMINAIKNGTPYEERPKGKWVGDTDYESYQGNYEAYKCSVCGHSLHWRDYYSNKYNFCPSCGARMESDV